MKYYTLEDISIAKWMLETKNFLDHGIAIPWAEKVVAWNKTFLKIAKVYAQHFCNGYDVAVKILWINIRRFRRATDIFKLLRSTYAAINSHNFDQVIAHYVKRKTWSNKHEMSEFNGIQMRSRSSKSERRTNVVNKTALTHKLFAQGAVLS